jgi:hypothetical protein
MLLLEIKRIRGGFLDNRFCTQCKDPVQKEHLFCSNCGSDLSLQTYKNDKPLISTPEGNYLPPSFKEKPVVPTNNKPVNDVSYNAPKMNSFRFLPHLLHVLVIIVTYQVIYGYFSFASHPDLPIQLIILSFFSALIAVLFQYKFPSHFIYVSFAVVAFISIRSIFLHESYREWLQFQSYAYQHGSGFDFTMLRSFIFVCVMYLAATAYGAVKRKGSIAGYSHKPREAR